MWFSEEALQVDHGRYEISCFQAVEAGYYHCRCYYVDYRTLRAVLGIKAYHKLLVTIVAQAYVQGNTLLTKVVKKPLARSLEIPTLTSFVGAANGKKCSVVKRILTHVICNDVLD